MTRRDLQLSERAKQRPWDLGKDIENGAPAGPITPADKVGHLTHAAITLKQNGELKQNSNISELVWSVPELISHLSGYYHLGPGDLIFTGTPAGVGPVAEGDLLEGEIVGLGPLVTRIGPAE
jgi:fumarylpyruvate hydrolase